jgi:hypothetical protein
MTPERHQEGFQNFHQLDFTRIPCITHQLLIPSCWFPGIGNKLKLQLVKKVVGAANSLILNNFEFHFISCQNGFWIFVFFSGCNIKYLYRKLETLQYKEKDQSCSTS